jgi:MoaA/NifB/PqqE/SkfB family radical SAM enzyme
VDYVVVSLDFDDPQEHNDNRKFAGLFESAVSGIEELKRLRRNGRPGIRTNTVLMKENLARAGEILDYLDGIVDDVHVQPISYGLENNPHNRGRERIYKYVFDESERAETERHLEEQVLSRKSFANNYFRKIKDYWFEPEKLAQKTPCWAPFLRMLIQPTGEVLHCAANSEFGVVGNLTDQALMEVWNGDQLRGDREIIGRKKNNCICWSRDTSFNSFMDDLPLANRLPYLGKKRLDPGL